MTALLEILQEAASLRQEAEAEFRLALKRAAEQHTLRELASVTGLTRQGVHYLLRREREETER